jgi:hypothetical protein
MKTCTTIKLILTMRIIFVLFLAGMQVNAQVTIPDFQILNSSTVSTSEGYHDGCGWVDMDNDGDLDLIINNSFTNTKPNLMYRNERNGNFVQVKNTAYTEQNVTLGLPGPFGDIDNDGDADLVLVAWSGNTNYIFKNDGYGYFSNVNSLARTPYGMSVLLDINGDSFLDLIDLNSAEGKIYQNDGQGSFSNFEHFSVTPPTPSSYMMTATFGDADNDGDFDLYYAYSWDDNYPYARNAFYLNNGSGSFVKEPDTSVIVSKAELTLSVNWVDYDNDNDMDLYVLLSSIYGPATQSTDILYENKGGLHFEKRMVEPNPYYNSHKTSSMWGDLDNDGDLDVLLAGYAFANNGKDYLYENLGNDNSWIELTCKGTNSNRSAYGARVNVIANINGKKVIQTREITPQTGRNTSFPSSRLHFGLGDANTVDTLLIRWPLGHVDTFVNVEANQFYRAIEDSVLEIDFTATNYIRYGPYLDDTVIYEGESLEFNLEDYYQFVKGDTVQEFQVDTLSFSLHSNDNPDAVNAVIESNVLTLTPGTTAGVSDIRVLVSAGFTERVDAFNVEYKEASGIFKVLNTPFSIYPNPANDYIRIQSNLSEKMHITICSASGTIVREDIINATRGTIEIPVHDLTSGIYIITIKNDQYFIKRKFIKGYNN